jgi:hypothetical protein
VKSFDVLNKYTHVCEIRLVGAAIIKYTKLFVTAVKIYHMIWKEYITVASPSSKKTAVSAWDREARKHFIHSILLRIIRSLFLLNDFLVLRMWQ